MLIEKFSGEGNNDNVGERGENCWSSSFEWVSLGVRGWFLLEI